MNPALQSVPTLRSADLCGLALFLIITLFPFFVMLMTSFKGAKEAISLHPTLLPQQWTLEHYVDI
ncbi:hypothetical protein L6R34_33040, partial [Escherichia coli]|nr:hypothetical protein [Escherichia coli]